MNTLIAVAMGLLLIIANPASADHQDIALFASPDLVGTGLTKFLLPRFSLKTGVRVHVEPLVDGDPVPPGADVVLQPADGGPGRLVLRGLDQDFAVTQIDPDNPVASRLTTWLLSEIGQRTIGQYAPEGTQMFTGAASEGPVEQVVVLPGDARRGEGLAYTNCGRCHVIGERNRMKGIGSTPSFALLRSFANWQDRFEGFYALNPHPSFSQISEVTAPFDISRPPPISPLSLTLGELDDIVAFAGSIEPANLGAALEHQ